MARVPGKSAREAQVEILVMAPAADFAAAVHWLSEEEYTSLAYRRYQVLVTGDYRPFSVAACHSVYRYLRMR